MKLPNFLLLLLAVVLFSACDQSWNDPYPAAETGNNILYTAFLNRPKHLDPVQSFSEDEINFTAQIYQAPLQYHYLKRPYTVIPATVEAVPHPRLFDARGRELPDDAPADQVVESLYELRLKPGIMYQPHPAFAVDEAGRHLYEDLSSEQLKDKFVVSDFPQVGTRELRADDYIYQMKRMAHPRLHSPIFGVMSEKIVGLDELGKELGEFARQNPDVAWLDMDAHTLKGVEKVDDYTWRVRIKGRYPQFNFWLTMPFFAPVPREVDRFFSQPGMVSKNMTLDWWPVGTGPYMLTENDPNRRMVLTRNPNFKGEAYPCEGEEGDKEAGLLVDCGKEMPFIDQAVFTREKEAIPYWNKFLQGYYDASGIASDSFDQAIKVDVGGGVSLSDEMAEKGIRLLMNVESSTFYIGFNMLDPVVGGMDAKGAKLRQAVSIAIDQEEFISIFMNGRGVPGMSPLPPGIFGFEPGEAGVNPFVYDWVDGAPRRKSVEEARRLLAESGWPNGRHAKTGEPLVLYLDTTGGGMGDKSRLDWLTRQLKKIDVQLVIRATDFNRFQDKIDRGTVQLYFLGWNADYPDPENFFFLLHGPGGRVKFGGSNSSNYMNPVYDRLFIQMKRMDNTPERLQIIREMNHILQQDAPWIYVFHPKRYVLVHSWLMNRNPSSVVNNTLKYQRLDPEKRKRLRAEWNHPDYGPPLLILVLPAVFLITVLVLYRRRERKAAV